jgi:hypothetical protein
MHLTEQQKREIQRAAQKYDADEIRYLADTTFEQRFGELCAVVAQMIDTGHGTFRRLKRSVSTWCDMRRCTGQGKTTGGARFWVLKVGAGLVVAVAATVAVVALGTGWAVLVPTGLAALLTKLACTRANKKWTKHQVISELRAIERQGRIPEMTFEQGPLAEMMLVVLFTEGERLRGKLEKYGELLREMQRSDSRIGKRFRDEVVEQANHAAMGRTISGGFFTTGVLGKGLKGTSGHHLNRESAVEKLGILVRRQMYMIDFISRYVQFLQEQLCNMITNEVANWDRDISRIVRAIIAVGPQHLHCTDCCFGPGDGEPYLISAGRGGQVGAAEGCRRRAG